MFYVNFINLCARDNVKPAAVGRAINVSGAAISKWKNGGMPSDVTLAKIADYFNVSKEQLLADENNTEEETSPAEMTEEEELQYVLEQYKNRPCLRMLFKVSDKATAKHVYQAAEQIEALTLLEEHKAADEQSED